MPSLERTLTDARKSRLAVFLDVALVVAAVGIAGALIAREVRARTLASAPEVRGSSQNPYLDTAWESALPASIAAGPDSAPVTIVEFIDFECPVCRTFHAVMRSIVEERRGQVTIRYVHYPLRQHRFAIPAARMAECADLRGKFSTAMDVLFDNQDSLGLKSWRAIAQEIDANEADWLAHCASQEGIPKRIEAGRLIGEQLRIDGTPTVFVNGWRFPGAPSKTEFDRVIDALIAGTAPYDSNGRVPR